MTTFFTKNKGFSLVETLLYVTLVSIVLFSVVLLLSFLTSTRVKNATIYDVNSQGTYVMHVIVNTVRNAESIDFPTASATSSILSLTVSDGMLSPTVFDVSSGTLRIKEGASNPIPITNSHVTVSSLVFQTIAPTSSIDKTVKVSFTISYNNPNNRNEMEFSQSFSGSATLRK
ncbi:MAG: hypothetical protein QG653_199 [Patescibacteria group bacterium]|nr:hypothetical protein [Patescibacteria group bacterium]